MKITSVEAIPIEARLSAPFKFGHVVRTTSMNVVTKITTESGETGWGEACPVPQLTGETQQSIVAAVQDRYAAALVGTDPLSWRPTLARMAPSFVGYTFTRAALETALVDLSAKVLGVPAWQYLGGRFRDRIPLHGSIGWDSDSAVVVRSSREQAAEFRTLKLYAGPGSLEGDLATIDAVREGVGDGVDLIVDVNGLWSRTDARRAAPRLAAAGVRLLEQPLAPGDTEGAAQLASLYGSDYGIDVAVDEGLRLLSDAVAAGRDASATVATVAALKLGGPATARDVAQAASLLGLGVMVGSVVELGIATTAGALLAATVEHLAYPAYLMGFRKYERQVTVGIEIIDGSMTVPDGPGLGVTIDEDALRSMDLRTR